MQVFEVHLIRQEQPPLLSHTEGCCCQHVNLLDSNDQHNHGRLLIYILFI